MEKGTDYIEVNRSLWNERVVCHVESAFYDVAGFKAGKSSLTEIELNLLGDISGKSLLHLQCHFGQDTLSLARMGARVTGVDLSDKAIEAARQLAAETGIDSKFICCNVYDLPQHLTETFDVVFSSYGTIGWLPDLHAWAGIVARYLKPGGMFVFAEFHPVVWMFDNDFERVGYSYFNTGPIVETEYGTYADSNAPLDHQSVCWNHSIAEVVNNLLSHGLSIEAFQEFDYSPYNCFKHTEAFEPGKFRIAHLSNQIPMVYALKVRKPA
jgi:2-polyprenyl-3-methyl-5-hydroxy-6-metoxy-1,4-benzoquinol methylase